MNIVTWLLVYFLAISVSTFLGYAISRKWIFGKETHATSKTILYTDIACSAFLAILLIAITEDLTGMTVLSSLSLPNELWNDDGTPPQGKTAYLQIVPLLIPIVLIQWLIFSKVIARISGQGSKK